MMQHDGYCRCGCGRMNETHLRPQPCVSGWCAGSEYPSCGQKTQGFLLPKIMGSGRTCQRACSLCLQVEGLPADIQPPLTLCCVQACGGCSWSLLPDEARHGLCLKVHIPLVCQVQDACGKMHTGRSEMTAEVPVRLNVPFSECWRCSVLVQPCVRLVCPPCCAEQPCFEVQLEVLAEAWLVRWEPCMTGGCRPHCPELPLYPQPCSCGYER